MQIPWYQEPCLVHSPLHSQWLAGTYFSLETLKVRSFEVFLKSLQPQAFIQALIISGHYYHYLIISFSLSYAIFPSFLQLYHVLSLLTTIFRIKFKLPYKTFQDIPLTYSVVLLHYLCIFWIQICIPLNTHLLHYYICSEYATHFYLLCVRFVLFHPGMSCLLSS